MTQNLVFIGGGHSHAIALKQWGLNPIPGVNLTLITDVYHTPYSGMLPGYIAGLYDFEECHIDLRPLAKFAQARLIVDSAIGLDLNQNRVRCQQHPPISFDYLSIDIGSTPNRLKVPGAADYTIPVKPISKFLQYWDKIQQQTQQFPQQKQRLAIVGGGAGGVELAFSIQSHLHRIYQQHNPSIYHLELHIFHRGDRLIPERHPWVGKTVQNILSRRGVQLHLQETVSQVTTIENTKKIQCQSGLTLEFDTVFWVTQAGAAPWLKQAGLATDERGFIQVQETLQSVSHPHIFAAGDVATMVNYPRPKAGVFAVRQGQPLFKNLQRILQKKPLKPFIPQHKFLILIGTGDEKAIASRGGLRFGPYAWLWRWKDTIDRKFMDQFRNLSPTMTSAEPFKMRCSGCGSKMGASVLNRVLNQLQPQTQRNDILIGINQGDDGAVLTIPDRHVLVQTVDYFPALIDDPYLFGKITANHCLSDLFAMGAKPQSALAIVTLPEANLTQQEETLYHLLSGAIEVLNSAAAVLVGGHTTAGKELAFGLTCNGIIPQDQLLTKAGLKPGDGLILTKALGTGTLFAADMQLQAKGDWIKTAIESMLLSNQRAADCLQRHQVTACTDVTGFGLLGHLMEMVTASQVAVELKLGKIPILPGVTTTLKHGLFSSIYPENITFSQRIQNRDSIEVHPRYPILFDPQTSGGLLAGVPAEQVEHCLQDLQSCGYDHSCLIGWVKPLKNDQLPLTIYP